MRKTSRQRWQRISWMSSRNSTSPLQRGQARISFSSGASAICTSGRGDYAARPAGGKPRNPLEERGDGLPARLLGERGLHPLPRGAPERCARAGASRSSTSASASARDVTFGHEEPGRPVDDRLRGRAEPVRDARPSRPPCPRGARGRCRRSPPRAAPSRRASGTPPRAPRRCDSPRRITLRCRPRCATRTRIASSPSPRPTSTSAAPRGSRSATARKASTVLVTPARLDARDHPCHGGAGNSELGAQVRPIRRERRRVHRAARREDPLLRDAEALDERARVRLAHGDEAVGAPERGGLHAAPRESARGVDGAHDPRRTPGRGAPGARARDRARSSRGRRPRLRARAPPAGERPAGSGAGRPSTRARGPPSPRGRPRGAGRRGYPDGGLDRDLHGVTARAELARDGRHRLGRAGPPCRREELQDPHAPYRRVASSLSMSSVVEWSFGSPATATRPP